LINELSNKRKQPVNPVEQHEIHHSFNNVFSVFDRLFFSGLFLLGC
jgi:hypothetical protein